MVWGSLRISPSSPPQAIASQPIGDPATPREIWSPCATPPSYTSLFAAAPPPLAPPSHRFAAFAERIHAIIDGEFAYRIQALQDFASCENGEGAAGGEGAVPVVRADRAPTCAANSAANNDLSTRFLEDAGLRDQIVFEDMMMASFG